MSYFPSNVGCYGERERLPSVPVDAVTIAYRWCCSCIIDWTTEMRILFSMTTSLAMNLLQKHLFIKKIRRTGWNRKTSGSFVIFLLFRDLAAVVINFNYWKMMIYFVVAILAIFFVCFFLAAPRFFFVFFRQEHSCLTFPKRFSPSLLRWLVVKTWRYIQSQSPVFFRMFTSVEIKFESFRRRIFIWALYFFSPNSKDCTDDSRRPRGGRRCRYWGDGLFPIGILFFVA